MNHKNQKPNPGHFPDPETGLLLSQWLEINKFDKWGGVMHDAYTGTCFVFNRVKSLRIGNLTLENPVTYGMDLSYTEDFTVENIQFDYYEGSPKLWNMDGVHIDGGCKNGLIRNLHGACYDDTVAITSDDSLYGPIENITVDGIYAYNSHSAVRLLSARTPVKNIHITNIYGTYYAEAIIISKYIEAEERSAFENITISNVYASLSPGTVDVPGNKRPLIAIGNDMDLTRLSISHIYRNETHCPNATIGVEENSRIGLLSVYCASQTNATEKTMAFIENKGEIEKLYLTHVDCGGEPLLIGEGITREIVRI